MKYSVRHKDRTFDVDVSGEAPDYVVVIDGRRMPVNAAELGDHHLLSMLVDHQSFLAHVERTDAPRGRFEVSIAGKFVHLEVLDELSALAQQMKSSATAAGFVLEAPMPGLIVDVRVQTGDRVEVGSPLVVMEAMKMQNELASEVVGTVSEVQAQIGQAVESGMQLVIIDPD